MNKGVIAINKPKDWTSFDVVNKIKHMVKPNKVGHLGTLDPMATGVLLVTVGKATKLFDIMQEKEKTYVATFEFGYETDTLDATGNVIRKNGIIPSQNQIEQVLLGFIGKTMQIPPMYSAKSVNGVRAYAIARRGEQVELKPKEIVIHKIKILNFINNKLVLEIVCGSGTYIRAIGRDIAYKLDACATMTELIRTKVGKFSIDNCKNIEDINKDNVFNNHIPLNEILEYKVLSLTDELQKKLLNGQTINVNVPDGSYFIQQANDIVAIANILNFKAKMTIFLA